jgi:hypothetical protein
MAEFTLTVNAQVPPYSESNESIITENCTDELVTYPVGVQRLVADPSRVYLVQNYTGDAWKTLHLTYINYDVSDFINTGDVFYLEYLGVKVEEGQLSIDIDIQSLTGDDLIPGLVVKSSISAGELSSRVISLGYSIEDINNSNPITRNNVISEGVITCSTPIGTALISGITANTTNPCSSTGYDFAVSVPEGDSIHFVYRVLDNGGVPFDGHICRLDGPSGNIDNRDITLVMSNVQNKDYKLIYNPIIFPGEENNIFYFRTYICSSPLQQSPAVVELELLAQANGAVVHTFNLTDIY